MPESHHPIPEHETTEQRSARIHDRLNPESETARARATAERQQTLAPRAELMREMMSRVESTLSQHELPAFEQAKQRLMSGLDQVAETDQVMRETINFDLHLKTDYANDRAADRAIWEEVNLALGTGQENPHRFAQMLEQRDLPEISANEPGIYHDTYRQGDTLFIPTKDPGVMLTVEGNVSTAAHEMTRPGRSPELRIGLAVSPDQEGFAPLPPELPEQHERAQAARAAVQEAKLAPDRADFPRFSGQLEHPTPQYGRLQSEQPEQSAGTFVPRNGREAINYAKAQQEGLLAGQFVHVQRSPESGGHVEANWRIQEIKDGRATVTKRVKAGLFGRQTKLAQKTVPLGRLAELQQQAPTKPKSRLARTVNRLLGRG